MLSLNYVIYDQSDQHLLVYSNTFYKQITFLIVKNKKNNLCVRNSLLIQSPLNGNQFCIDKALFKSTTV